MTRTRPKVLIVGTGGTISRIVEDRLDFYEYMLHHGSRGSIEELLEITPEVADEADIIASNFSAMTGKAGGDQEWRAVLGELHGQYRDNPDMAGAIVTSGTSSLEELAYFLNLTHRLPIPVAVVGAMRPNGVLASEGGLNLLGAVKTVLSKETAGLGVMVVMNGEIHSARDVTKSATMAVGAFQSRSLGPLGFVDPAFRGVAIYRQPTRRRAPESSFDLNGFDVLPKTMINYSFAGSKGEAVRAFVASGARAIVSAGFGSGSPTAAEREALLSAQAEGVLIVAATRAGSGIVTAISRRVDDRFVCADNLVPQHARILAMLALTRTDNVDEIQEIFNTY